MTIDRDDNKLTESSQDVGGFYYKSSDKPSYPSILDRFVKRIQQTFQYWNVEETKGLSGRAQAVIPRINVLLDQLKNIDETSGDRYLYNKYIAIPLIREGTKLREEIITSGEPISHQLTSQYILWIDRSYRWVDRFFKLDSSKLNQAVMDYIIKDSRGRVDKDLHLVSDYIEQQLENLDIGDELIQEVNNTIEQQLDPVLGAMKSIEETHPNSKDPDRVHLWRENLHMLRQKFFDQCLEIVDSVIEIKTPKRKSPEKNKHLIAALESILSLEDSIKEFFQNSEGSESDVARKHVKRKVVAFYQQAHKISLDIRLSQELFDRVQQMMSSLTRYYDRE